VILQLLHVCRAQLTAGAAIAIFMMPLSQIQTLDEISWLAYSGADSLPDSDRP